MAAIQIDLSQCLMYQQLLVNISSNHVHNYMWKPQVVITTINISLSGNPTLWSPPLHHTSPGLDTYCSLRSITWRNNIGGSHNMWSPVTIVKIMGAIQMKAWQCIMYQQLLVKINTKHADNYRWTPQVVVTTQNISISGDHTLWSPHPYN